MSYASVVAANASPLDDQPKPDPNLLEGRNHGQSTKDHNSGLEQKRDYESDDDETEPNQMNHTDPKPEKTSGAKRPTKTENKNNRSVEKSDKKFQAISLVNALALGGTALIASKYWDQPKWDKRVLSGFIIGFGVLFGSQGYLSNSFHNLIRKQG